MFSELFSKIVKYITDKREKFKISQSRERRTEENREVLEAQNTSEKAPTEEQAGVFGGQTACSYCHSQKQIVKRGKRKKKHEVVQLYYRKRCRKTFTPLALKGKHYPLKIVLEGLSLYNLGYNLEETSRQLKERYGIAVKPATLNHWINEFRQLCAYSRLRRFGKKLYSPHQIAPGISLYHRQIYKFRIHRGKLAILLQEDPRHYKLQPLREFLEAMFEECPHHLFKEGQRASETKVNFSLSQVLIREKNNYANRLAE